MDKRELARLWVKLNKWEFPDEIYFKAHNDGKDHIRGAFYIVNKLISLKEVKSLTQDPL